MVVLVAVFFIRESKLFDQSIPLSPSGLDAALTLLLFSSHAAESPRWLLANGRDEEAHAFLVRFHGNKVGRGFLFTVLRFLKRRDLTSSSSLWQNPDSAMVALEWQEFKENIALDGSDKRWWGESRSTR